LSQKIKRHKPNASEAHTYGKSAYEKEPPFDFEKAKYIR
jgi:hypothetical protein